MTEYNIDFAERLIVTARYARGEGTYDFEAAQVVTYLTQLSIELSLKAFLEKAGLPVKQIKGFSHRLEDLLTSVGKCEVRQEVTSGRLTYVPATGLRGIRVNGQNTVGDLIARLVSEGSTYPDGIRYGTGFRGLEADIMLELASEAHRFVNRHWDEVRLSPKL